MSEDFVKLYKGDCLDVMDRLAKDGVQVDMVLTDPPYGTTDCKWDSVIPLFPMWEKIKKLITLQGSIALFGTEPFSSKVRMSNCSWYKYDWYWKKTRPTLFVHAKNRPLRQIELVSVFSQASLGHKNLLGDKRMHYNPQGVIDTGKICTIGETRHQGILSSRKKQVGRKYLEKTNFPRDILEYGKEKGKQFHPSQKPVALLEYLIKTYTKPGDTVLDFTMGSGSTGVAAVNTGRLFIGIELDDRYYRIAQERITEAQANAKLF